jgi:hypothetical protein
MPNKLSNQQKRIMMSFWERKEMWRQVANNTAFSNGYRGTALNHMIEYDRAIKNLYTKKEQPTTA